MIKKKVIEIIRKKVEVYINFMLLIMLVLIRVFYFNLLYNVDVGNR